MTTVALQTEPTMSPYRSAATDYSSQAFLGDNGSLVAQQNLALPVPLGSQLSLLDAQLKGNKYLQSDAKHNVHLTPQERAGFMSPPYDSMSGNGMGMYYMFGTAYSGKQM